MNGPRSFGMLLALGVVGIYFWTQPFEGANGSPRAIPPPPAMVFESPPSIEWTVFERSADTRVVYVSSTEGKDSNDGLSEAKPKKTIAAGKAQLRNGHPDWLLLKCGDLWNENFGGDWGLSGRSATERMLLSSYGQGSRPVVRSGTDNGFRALDGSKNDYLAIVGLFFWAHTYGGANGSPRGIAVFGAVHDLLIEDCYLQAYETNIVLQGTPDGVGRHKNVTIRRNVIVDAYTTGKSNAQGLYASGTDGLLIEENVFDRNGWRRDIDGSEPTWYRHNIYIQNLNTDVVLRGNIVARTDGAHMRSGGIVEDNLFLRNAIQIAFGIGGYPEIEKDGIAGAVRRNVVLDGGDFQADSPRGWGLWMSNVRQASVESNLFAHNQNGHLPFAMNFDVAVNGRGVENTVCSDNVVYDWNGPTRFTGKPEQLVNFRLVKNRFHETSWKEPWIVHDKPESVRSVHSEGNVFSGPGSEESWLSKWKDLVGDATSVAKAPEFPDPSRTIGSYHASIGGKPTLEAFLEEARQQSKARWRPEYTAAAANAYFRKGFGL